MWIEDAVIYCVQTLFSSSDSCVCTQDGNFTCVCAPNGCLLEGDLSGGLDISSQLLIFPWAAVED